MKALAQKDIPAAESENNTQHSGFDPKIARCRYMRYAREARKFVLGPMPVEQFLSTFLPVTDMSGMPSSEGAFKNIPDDVEEPKIYRPLVAALNFKNRAGVSRCPGFTFVTTSMRSENKHKIGSMTPDICCYADHSLGMVGPPRTAHFGYAELFFEVKGTSKHDFFTDPQQGADRSSHPFVLNISNKVNLSRAEQALGQNVAYATEACARQHRLFYFSVSVSGRSVRFIRWDRAGAIVTESFNVRERPELLCEFLWKFAGARDHERGYDPTVCMASKPEETLFKQAITQHVQLQLGHLDSQALESAVAEHYQKDKVVAIYVPDEDSADHTSHRYLVSRPVVSPLSMAGRATRGYWAVDSSGQVAFLKDTWRYAVSGMVQEGVILRDLNDKNVRNTPRFLHHGDVVQPLLVAGASSKGKRKMKQGNQFQCTQTNNFLDSDWLCTGQRQIVVVPHIHYRLVLATVGYGLRRFTGSRELLHATHDAYHAIIDAYDLDNRIHRDISVGNIVLVRHDAESEIRRGYLIDWELSCSSTRKDDARLYERTGTWQFMSCDVLLSQDKAHSIEDDMESMLYVVLYCSMRWLSHNLAEDLETLAEYCRALFDFVQVKADGSIIMGGTGKAANRLHRNYTRAIQWTCKPVHEWLNTVMNFNSPLPPSRGEFAGKWDGYKPLKDYWTSFLERNSCALGVDDKVEHPLPNVPQEVQITSYETTMASPGDSAVVYLTPSKRKAFGSVEGDDRQSKRPKTKLTPSGDHRPRTYPRPSVESPSIEGRRITRSMKGLGSRADMADEHTDTADQQRRSRTKQRASTRQTRSSQREIRTEQSMHESRPNKSRLR
ncbi:hypothetical protein AcV5_001383 [Taiwanofungus camphoratus]|nr:hypothetical protein AcV5_001383 [Antrodia cinnamomea]